MDIYTDTGVLQYQIKSTFSEYEVKKIRKRTEAGIIRSFLEGNYASPHSPFGYNKENGKLIVNKVEVGLVRTIHEIYLKDGMSIIGTAQYLNFNKLGESRWTENKVRKILYNMVYVGEVHRKDLGQVFFNSAPLLISRELKEDVLKKLSCNTRNTLTSSKHKFLDKVFCSECSNRCICDTHYRKDRVYRYYECKNCKLRINENDILEMISPEITEHLLEEVSNDLQKTIRKKITEFRRHQFSLNDMFDSGYISRDTYSREMATLSKSRSDYLRKIEIELNQKITLESMTIKESGKLIKRLIKEIRINLKTKRITKLELFK
ncbi:recombinase family protein [Erysipelothrix rhusiopathiae]|uniref:recombinase family protein n=1 Tax=Erysipelothrix rhusiopathiae TaxID=1648 RepID=UPI001EDF292C|nr:recombinase family protein [Erysipelothrix rhusiopathiae]MCG4437293.1 recombinase family protein [Erysipelothrix rhusiopathiae]